VSKGWVGQCHDYKQLKHEFPPNDAWFNDLPVSLDLGYQGFTKDYECQSVSQPTKKPKNAELSSEKKAENQQISSGRIWIEHAIGGLKRYRYLSDRLRTHKVDLYKSALLVCAGIWNFYLTN
jgi:hypothetical protein